MCGICGIIDYSGNSCVEEAILQRMCKELRHRGPDDEGIFINRDIPSVGLGHRRLSIIDLSAAGHQPMTNEDKTIWIVFNGEIYNFQDLRKILEDKKHRFKSYSDTEVVLHLYEEEGIDCVKKLRGMFAFAIWDKRTQTLLIARDRLGKKPLLYYFDDEKFCFASEFSSLLASNLINKQINLEAIDYYLSFGYVPAPLSIYKNIFKLLPAHILILKNKKIVINKYWQLDYSNKVKISEQEAAGEVLKLLREAVNIRLYSDVPLGAFLSGGIDSSTVVGLMSELSGKKIKTFSIGFKEKDYSELKYARKIAEHFNTEHHEFIVQPKALDVLALLVERYGEPYGDSSCIPTYYVAQQTKQYVTVALNGDGGDELFAGYERYQAMVVAERIPHTAKKIMNALIPLLPDSINPKSKLRRIKRFLNAVNLPTQKRYLRWVGIFDNGFKTAMYSEDFQNKVSKNNPTEWLTLNLNSPDELNLIDKLLMIDTNTYLPNDLLVKMDIVSMANSLEARSPFLDHKLIEFVAKLPTEYKMKRFTKKYLLKRTIKNLIPQENIYRSKMGFGVPVGEWFRNDLKDFLSERILCKTFFNRGYFKAEVIENMVKQHIKRQADYTFQLWALLMLELWHQKFID